MIRLRRTFPLALGLMLIVGLPTTVGLASAGDREGEEGTEAAAAARPNILLIVTDDQRADFWEPAMPRTVQLFRQGGTSYTNFYGTTPLCCPDRASFLSGRYAHNHGLRTNGDPSGVAAFDQAATMEGYLQGSGYLTGMMGKFLHPWEPLGRNPLFFDRWALTGSAYQSGYFNVNGTVRQLAGYNTTALAGQAIGDLQAWETQDATPWFLYVSTKAPHSPFTPESKYATATFPVWSGNPAVAEANVSDKPPSVTWRPTGSLAQGQSVRTNQLRTLRSVDDMVGAIFNEMVRLGEEQDTLAVFTSDNGFLWGEHRIYSDKRFPYTESVRIPFMVRWPNHVAAGATDNRLFGGIDMLPTFLEVAGAQPSLIHPLDGRSIFSSGERSRILLEYFLSPDGPLASWASIRGRTYQFIEWYNLNGTVKFREYYDLTRDPWQLTNLLRDGVASNDPNVAALTAQLAADRTCAGAACP